MAYSNRNRRFSKRKGKSIKRYYVSRGGIRL